jgi:hypothetical protein
MIFFWRVVHGALRRFRETSSPGGNGAPSEAAVATLLPGVFELLHLSQFQHTSVAGRLAESSLALVDELSHGGHAGLLAIPIRESLVG